MGKIKLLCLLLFVVCCGDSIEPKIVPEKKPNIVLIMADDQGWGDLSFNGNTNLSTPNIDALAKNGVSFEHFYVQPVCSPTRAELLTGRHSSRLGVYATSTGGERINLGETTIAEVFKKAGYKTAAYGKWHNGMQPPYHPNAKGFEDYYGFTSGHWGNYFSPMLEHNGKIVKGDGFLVDDLTNHGLDFISKHQGEPFFLYLPYNTPHSPMQVPDVYWDTFEDKELDLKYQGEEATNINHTKATLAMVENIDYNVGRITKKLEELGLEKNTIVIYLSDNGPNGWRWNGGMRGRKGSTDEGGVRTSFFVQWKNTIPSGKSVPQIASAIDLLPTLSSMANIDYVTKNPIDGRDLTPLLLHENPNWEPRIVYNHWRGKTSIRTQKYRLDNEDHLYDMQKDHRQTTDISLQFPQLTDSLIKMKKNWLSEISPLSKESDNRPFTLGHPDYEYTQIPVRDGIPHGNIKRSNRHPNNTFFTSWTSLEDSMTWDVEVLADGEFQVELYYTCKAENVGSLIELSLGESRIEKEITIGHDPPLTGMENDRDPRIESYVKDFIPMDLGKIKLKKGKGELTLKATEITGKEVADVRLLMFRRIQD
ncbi:MAG: arylsulfatase [Maribacter sp.]|nr:arylsulfatase [Maribacter sp.]